MATSSPSSPSAPSSADSIIAQSSSAEQKKKPCSFPLCPVYPFSLVSTISGFLLARSGLAFYQHIRHSVIPVSFQKGQISRSLVFEALKAVGQSTKLVVGVASCLTGLVLLTMHPHSARELSQTTASSLQKIGLFRFMAEKARSMQQYEAQANTEFSNVKEALEQEDLHQQKPRTAKDLLRLTVNRAHAKQMTSGEPSSRARS
eukprot:TRINITY_DN2551_c0_g1_i1.p1 TRINITY_DN2551_c0_g1~~TRINITY_DN2551_c0_g1_i1.p1  ORF type:complete len:203 (+),score=20.88 TRINITY_DN2551_c0_g1_i1:98-706(+)